MKAIRSVLPVACLSLLSMTGAARADESPSVKERALEDAKILRLLHAKIQTELPAARAAKEQGRSAKMAAFADILIRDLVTADFLVQRHADRVHVTLVSPPPRDEGEEPRLEAGDFDQALLNLIRREDKEALKLLTQAKASAEIEDFRLLIENLTTIFDNHSKIAKSITLEPLREPPREPPLEPPAA
jgi:predicted outer membrane protein